MFCKTLAFLEGLYQHKTLWHHTDLISIIVFNYAHHILTASKISQNTWELVLERILQNLMTCTDIQNLSSFCLFSFKCICSSLEEVCSSLGKKIQWILSIVYSSLVFSSGNFNAVCYIIYIYINICKCRNCSGEVDLREKLLNTLRRHGVTLPVQQFLPDPCTAHSPC